MKQIAVKMKLYPGFADEYKKRHYAIWPGLKTLLKESGIYDYSIFLDPETNILFASYKVKENNSLGELPEQEIMKRWWDYMKDIMETNPDHSPAEKPLLKMFYLE